MAEKCMYICMYACVYICMHACIYACVYICMHVCIYACLCVYMHACVYIGMYACVAYLSAYLTSLTSFVHSSINGHLGSFHDLATVNYTAVNLGEWISL